MNFQNILPLHSFRNDNTFFFSSNKKKSVFFQSFEKSYNFLQLNIDEQNSPIWDINRYIVGLDIIFYVKMFEIVYFSMSTNQTNVLISQIVLLVFSMPSEYLVVVVLLLYSLAVIFVCQS